MEKLRAPDGCPWDREQGFSDIARYTIEEAYEVADAVARDDMVHLREELGDLLFQVVFHARIGEEAGAFTLRPNQRRACRQNGAPPSACLWRREKQGERTRTAYRLGRYKSRRARPIKTPIKLANNKSLLDDVPLALPALMRAEKLQKRAARVGFDWPNLDGVLDKIVEEAQEVREAVESGSDNDAIEDEIGDLLFALTNLARKIGVDPEVALRRTNDKFTRRFKSVEAGAKAQETRAEQI